MVVDRRRELLDAGVSIALRQRLQELLAGADTRTIAEAAGVTSGSFFHHFRTRAAFATSVADRFGELWAERVDHLVSASGGAAAGGSPDAVREAAAAEWVALMEPSDTLRLQHLLWVASNHPLSDDTAVTAGQVLRGAYDALNTAVVPIYERGLLGIGREMLPPFSTLDLAVIMNAIAEGLRMRAEVDPSVRDELYVDTVAAVLIGITRPRVERREIEPPIELSTLEARFRVRRPESTPEAPLETWRHIADAAAHLFADRSSSEVRIAEVATVAGVSTSTVYHHFGTVAAVAAAGFARHVPELEQIARTPLTAEEGPLRRIEQVLLRYVELVRANRGAAEAIVSEAMVECNPSGPARPRGIRALVPMPDLILEHVRELRARGLLRRRIEGPRLSRSLVHLVTMQALLFPDESVERVVDETMGLVFDGALVTSTDN